MNMKKAFLIAALTTATLLSACQNPVIAPADNSTDQSKQEKASSEAKVFLTIEGQPNDNPKAK